MSQYLSMLPSQQMRLEQRLTPQLIQAMEILQLPLLALEARVREELESNPVLEEIETEPVIDRVQPKEDLPASETGMAEAESFERLERMAREMDFDSGDLPYGRGSGSSDGRDSKLDAMANTASRGEGLKEQLLREWSLVEAPTAMKQAGEVIIDWMDEDGYLRSEADHHPRRSDSDAPEAMPLVFRRSPEETDRLMEEIASSRKPPVDREVLEEALMLVSDSRSRGRGGEGCDRVSAHSTG